MHHGTCVTHVPWCMSGSLTHGCVENVPGIPGACATHKFTYLARGPCLGTLTLSIHVLVFLFVELIFEYQLCTGNSVHLRLVNRSSWESVEIFERAKCLYPGGISTSWWYVRLLPKHQSCPTWLTHIYRHHFTGSKPDFPVRWWSIGTSMRRHQAHHSILVSWQNCHLLLWWYHWAQNDTQLQWIVPNLSAVK